MNLSLPGPAADPRHMSIFTHKFLSQLLSRHGLTVTIPSGVDASPEWFSKISPNYLCKTIAVEGKK